MNDTAAAALLSALGAPVLAASAFFSYEALSEAYGSGPPYYSRTTNMDKWSSPLPAVLIGDAAAVAVAVFLMRSGFRKLRSRMK